MNGRKRIVIGGIAALAIGTSLVYVVGRARAAGVPTMPPTMTYSGTLSDLNGALLTGSKNIQFQLWNVATGGAPVCSTASSPQTLAAGTFQVALPETCVAAVHAGGDLWTEILVDGTSLGRTKIGAVPFALEAATASAAAGALDTRLATLMPPKSIITANLTAAEVTAGFDTTGLGKTPGPYAGWAICNGANGTPNLAARFLRLSATAAGATGGTDSSAHTHPTPAHQHVMPIGFDSGNFYWTADGGGFPAYGSNVITSNRAAGVIGGFATALTRQAYTDSSGAGTSGAASVADNRPAYYELVALMRL